MGSLARGLLLALPVAVIIGWLLASADAVLASMFAVELDVTSLPAHFFVMVAVLWVVSGLTAGIETNVVPRPAGLRWRIGTIETMCILAAVVTIYGLFAVSQLLVTLEGPDYVARTTGLSYADYARSGFFQLLWAAGLTLLLLLLLRSAARVPTRRSRRVFVGLSLAAIALTLVAVLGAVTRLDLYEEVFGATMLRLYSTIFAWWIGVVFVLTAGSFIGIARHRNWLPGAIFVSAMVTLVWVNWINPEDVVMQRNIEHAEATGKFDIDYALGLSDDAVPPLVQALPDLPLDLSQVAKRLCQPDDGRWNLSAHAADEARHKVCS